MKKGINMGTRAARASFLGGALLALAACGTAEQKDVNAGGAEAPKAASEKAANTGTGKADGFHTEKPSAPVSIEGKLEAGKAAVEIVFETEGTDVSVELWGVDGVVVTSDKAPIKNRRAAKGERVTLDVSFTTPTNRADLAVSVKGTFAGQSRSKVRSFTVNPNAPPLTNAPGEVKTGPDGQPVRVMKAQ